MVCHPSNSIAFGRASFAALLILFLPRFLLSPTPALAWYRVGTGSDDSLPCNAYYSSSLAFKPSTDSIEFCDGTTWNSLLGVNGRIALGTSTSAASPQVLGDPTTGLFSAATSTISIATNGVQQVTVNSSGYVGIGTATPAAKLDLWGTIDVNGSNGIWQDTTNSNTVVGASAFPATVTTGTGTNNTALGYQALNSATTADSSVAVGSLALNRATTGGRNVAIGYEAMWLNTSGTYNAAIGLDALASNTAGGNNLAIGANALLHTNANGNVGIGVSTLQTNTSGGSNVAIGNGVASTILSTGSGNILIGTSSAIDTPASDTSNFLNIGNVIFATGMTGTVAAPAGNIGIGTAAPVEPLEIYSAGSGVLLQLAGSGGTCNHTPGLSSETVSCSSDIRLKDAIVDTPTALPWLSSIRLRDFASKRTGQKGTGVIAQELQQAHPEMVTYDKKKDEWTVEQPNPWTLVKLLQEQQAEIDDLKKQLAAKQ